MAQLEQGSPAKDETLQLRVGLNNVGDALEYFKAFQATPSPTVDQLLPDILGQLKVTNAEVAPARAGVINLTGIATLATGTVKWFNEANYVEIYVKNNSKERFNVFNSNGADEGFQEVNAGLFLGAAVADIKKNYEKELQSILRTQGAAITVRVWTADFKVIGERFHTAIQNAEVIPTTSGTTYKFYYDQGIPAFLPFPFANVTDGQIFLNVTRTELIPEAALL